MKGKVYTPADVKLSKKGAPYAIFSIQDSKGNIFKCLAFNELAKKCEVIDRVSESIIVDGDIKPETGSSDMNIFLKAFVLPEREKMIGDSTGGSRRPSVMVTDSRPYELTMRPDKTLWCRWLNE